MRFVLILALLSCSVGLVQAACGTPGGNPFRTFERPEEPDYTPMTEAESKAAKNQTGIVWAFAKENGSFPACWADGTRARSKKLPHVRLAHGDAPALAKRFGITAYPAVAMTDAHGNLVALWQRQCPIRKIESTQLALPSLIAALQKRMRKNFEEGKALADKDDDSADAIAALSKVAVMLGYPEVDQAKKLLGEIEGKGKQELDLIMATDQNKIAKRKALRALGKRFAGSALEDEIKAAIKQL